MHKVDKCEKCGSSAIVHRAMVVQSYASKGGGERNINLRVDGDPSAIFRKKTARSIVRAEVCSVCGYVEFYADDPAALMVAFNQAQRV